MRKSMWLYDVVTFIVKWLLKPLFWTKTTGLENENVEGPVIYCLNHISNWDPVIVACETKKTINFMAKKELFEVPVIKHVVAALGVFPIDRQGNDLATLKSTINGLKEGRRICIFPQGTRHPGIDPRTTEVKGGTAMLARHSKATVVPIGVYTKDYKVRIFRRVYVNIGKPKTFEELGFTGARDDYDRITGEIFNEICNLCESAKENVNAKKCK
ncbi:MAG: 1-acyl-sn-glycerol-3-phosphate acyltransferase [Ruminococcaceae bacterium]|nr:1-acyl-sn-glycerol-3-phosphate acyltransferase [Oscillospiraceae bacterium]